MIGDIVQQAIDIFRPPRYYIDIPRKVGVETRRLLDDAHWPRKWSLSQYWWTHRSSGASFWVVNGRERFAGYRKRDLDSPTLNFTRIETEALWRASLIHRNAHIGSVTFPSGEDDDSLPDAAGSMTPEERGILWRAHNRPGEWREDRHFWVHRPTGLAFWIANGRRSFECRTSDRVTAITIDLSPQAMSLIWDAYTMSPLRS